MVRAFSFSRMWALFTGTVATALFVAMLLPITATAMSSSVLITLTNQQRTQNGLQTLNYNAQLSASAMAKAQHMIANDYWAHDAPDGTSPWTFMRANDYDYTTAGENLAKGFVTDSSTISGWMNSPGHRANILNSRYRDVGIAVVRGVLQGVDTSLIVAHYGSTNSVYQAPVSQPEPVAQTQPKPITQQPELANQPAFNETAPSEPTKPETKVIEVVWQDIVIDVVKKALFIRFSWLDQQPRLNTILATL